MKTNKSIKSRFRITGTGKLKRQRPGKRHILTKKTPKRKRQLRKPTLVHEAIKRTYMKVIGA